MRLIKMTGGMGNQMFIYALYLRMRRDFPDTRIDLSDMQHYHAHHGYMLWRAFGLPRTEVIWPQWLKKVVEFLFFRTILERKQKGALRAYRKAQAYPLLYFKGFYQHERYFTDMADEVRQAFTFDLSAVNAPSLALRERLLADAHSVSIHVRRGDYLHPKFREAYAYACTLDYYHRAIATALAADPEAHFYLFSDDTAWCEAHLSLPEGQMTIVACNTGQDSWQDMMLMSLCRHNIIANSTFSWWGAWLNAHPQKRVYCPEQWTHGNDSSIICPPEWTRISHTPL